VAPETCEGGDMATAAALSDTPVSDWNTVGNIAGALWTSADLGFSHDCRICREIAESASWTPLARNEGVPGSSPGVGFGSRAQRRLPLPVQ
jgi:hypothetical protein